MTIRCGDRARRVKCRTRTPSPWMTHSNEPSLPLCENPVKISVRVEIHLGCSRPPMSVVPPNNAICVGTDSEWKPNCRANLTHVRHWNSFLPSPRPILAVYEQPEEA